MKKELLLALLVVSLVLISACDVYNTLYVKQATEEVPDHEADVVSGEVMEEEMEDIEALMEEISIEEVMVEDDVEEDIAVEEGEITAEDVEVEVREIPEDASVIIVEETELLSLAPEAEDPDNDLIIFTFTSPLDENGEWQTSYGDAGEYTITVTASDGTLTSSKEVLIIVNKREEAPVMESFSPEEGSLEVEETGAVDFEIIASDLNNDELSYSWKLDGVEVANEPSYAYQTDYDGAGSHTIKGSVSDGVFDTEKIWAVTVNNVNRAPVLEPIGTIEADEADTVTISLSANDLDGDELSYNIDDQRFSQDNNVFTWQTTYDDAGEYAITVSVSDGVDTVTEQVSVTVNNVNRAPVILDIVQK